MSHVWHVSRERTLLDLLLNAPIPFHGLEFLKEEEQGGGGGEGGDGRRGGGGKRGGGEAAAGFVALIALL